MLNPLSHSQTLLSIIKLIIYFELMEHCIAGQLIYHVSRTRHCEILCVYRSNYSTEMALLKVKDNLLHNMGDKKIICLVLLDVAAAFGTVDDCIMLECLCDRCWICQNVLKWSKDYFTGRHKKVVIQECLGSTAFSEIILDQVLQGCILEPVYFILYT